MKKLILGQNNIRSNEFGSEVQVSVDHALSLGLIDRAPKKGKTVGIHAFANNIYKRK